MFNGPETGTRALVLASLKAYVTNRLLPERSTEFLCVTGNATYSPTQLPPGRDRSDPERLQGRQFLVVQVWASEVPMKSPAHRSNYKTCKTLRLKKPLGPRVSPDPTGTI